MRRISSPLIVCAVLILAGYAVFDAATRLPGPIGRALAVPDASHGPAFVPERMSYQGRLLDSATGNPLPDGQHTVVFTVHDHPTDPDPHWSEELEVTTTDGVFSVILGTITPIDILAFDGAEPPYLELTVEGEVLTPRQPFTTVAYAFFSQGAALANDSELFDGADSTEFLRTTGNQSKSGNLTLTNNLTVNGATALTSLSTTGSATLGDAAADAFTVNANTTFVNNAAVNGNTTIGNAGTDTLTVNANSTFVNDATVNGNATVGGNATLGNAGTDAHTVNGNMTLNNLLLLNGNATIGNAAGDAHTVNGNMTLNNSLFTFGTTTLGNDATDLTTLNGDLRLTTGDIENGGAFEIRLNPSGATGAVVVGGSTSQGDDLEIEDGGLCVATSNCDTLPADGHLVAEAGLCVGANACSNAPTTGSMNADGNLVLGWGEGTQAASVAFAPGGVVSGAMTYFQADARFSFNTDVVTSDGGLCVDDAIAPVCPALTDGTILADGAITANAFDLAEHFPAATNDLQAGELVTLGNGVQVRRSGGIPHDSNVIGIVSTDPGIVLGWEQPGDVPVALQGRVPVKVTSEGGPIAAGDHLAASSTPGHAMRAVGPGATIGIALEAFDGEDTGEVLVFIQRDSDHASTTSNGVDPTSPFAAAIEEGEASPWLTGGVAAALVMTLLAIVVIDLRRRRSVR